MMQHFNNDEKNLCGNFKIGTASNIAEIFLMDVLFMMQEHYSNFKISSFDLEPEEMFSFLFNNQLDYGFFGFSKQNYSYIKQLSEQYDNKIIITQLFESNTYAVFHKTHQLALKNKLFINDLHQIETTHYGQSSFLTMVTVFVFMFQQTVLSIKNICVRKKQFYSHHLL